jgi:O-antigen biosynthesis protein WbqP
MCEGIVEDGRGRPIESGAIAKLEAGELVWRAGENGPCRGAIRSTSEGPALFRQVRVGRDEKPFVCLKLRTMYAGTPSVPTHDAPAAAATRLGLVLRRWKLDELPQLWNVLVGEMSLVGPRPCLPSQHELIAERRRRGVFSIRPGVTGLAQVSGVDMSDPVGCAALDARYMAGMGLLPDMMILFRTFVRPGPAVAPPPQGS